jgi:hypothetical protein
MKEIWKLLELLNEYVEKHNKSDLYYTFELKDNWWLFCYDDVTDHKWWTMQDEAMVICSKKFWFIKWLVENDKIDLDNEELVSLMSELWEFNQYEKCLLMLLSIQDEPIRFLCEILK